MRSQRVLLSLKANECSFCNNTSLTEDYELRFEADLWHSRPEVKIIVFYFSIYLNFLSAKGENSP